MRKRCILSWLLLPLVLLAEDGPTVDLFAGWMWSPWAYGYPAPPYPSRWYEDDPNPTMGVAHAWNNPYAPWLYPYRYGYAYPVYGWGYDYGVRLRLKPGNTAGLPDLSDSLLPPLPGSAPTELKNATNDQAWSRTIEAFLATLPPASVLPAAETNAPAR